MHIAMLVLYMLWFHGCLQLFLCQKDVFFSCVFSKGLITSKNKLFDSTLYCIVVCYCIYLHC